MPSTSPKPSTDHVFTSALDPTIAPVLPEQKVERPKIHFMKLIVLLSNENIIYKVKYCNKGKSNTVYGLNSG